MQKNQKKKFFINNSVEAVISLKDIFQHLIRGTYKNRVVYAFQ